MQFLSLLMPVLSVVALAAFIWLVVVAFKQSPLWGILVLLLSPITAIIFAIKYWQESKKPFLVYMGSCLASLALLVVFFGALGGFQMMSMASQMADGDMSDEQVAQFIEGQMDRMENSGLLDEQEKRDLDKMRGAFQEMREEAAEPEVVVDPSLVVETPGFQLDASERPVALETVNEPNWQPASYGAAAALDAVDVPAGDIALREAGRLLGMVVKIVDRDGQVHKGNLTKVTSRSLVIERHLSSGTFSYEIGKKDVRTLRGLYPF